MRDWESFYIIYYHHYTDKCAYLRVFLFYIVHKYILSHYLTLQKTWVVVHVNYKQKKRVKYHINLSEISLFNMDPYWFESYCFFFWNKKYSRIYLITTHSDMIGQGNENPKFLLCTSIVQCESKRIHLRLKNALIYVFIIYYNNFAVCLTNQNSISI